SPTGTSPLLFDRVLCDVPCSGDATLRKNPDIWLKWSTGNGNNLHGIQCRVLRRGCEVLAVGGRLVYSTCSFNPIENEAVVHRLLADAGGALRLVCPKNLVPGLVYREGMSHWRPATKDMVYYDKFEDVPEKWHTVLRPQMFPPTPEDAAKYNLNRCIRILPHHQDTGGFFVAILEKVSLLPWEKQNVNKTVKENSHQDPEQIKEPPQKKKRLGGYREDPYVFFSGETEDVLSQEGLSSIVQYIGPGRRLKIQKEDLITVLQCDNPHTPPELTKFSEHTQKAIEEFGMGSCVLEYEATDGSLNLNLVGWRGKKSLRAYTTSADTVHLLRLLGADYSKYDVNKFKKTADEQLEETEDTTVENTSTVDTPSTENGSVEENSQTMSR
ncbi:hypothetical protein ACJJTC_011891, partial [Scirpophaga incertulas]